MPESLTLFVPASSSCPQVFCCILHYTYNIRRDLCHTRKSLSPQAETGITHKITSNRSNPSTFRMRNNPHTNVPIIWPLQKNVLSTGLGWNSFEWVSNFHTSLPFSSYELHHLSPTKILPDIFLTTQKSNEPRMVTKIKVRTLDKIIPTKKYLHKSILT